MSFTGARPVNLLLTTAGGYVSDNSITGINVWEPKETQMNRIQLAVSERQQAGLADANRRTQTIHHDRKRRFARLLGCGAAVTMTLAACASQAALLTYEGFNYLPLSILGENGYTNYWTTFWGQFSQEPAYALTNLSLSDPSNLLYAPSNSVYTLGGYTERYFATSNDTSWAQPGVTNYWSILIQPNNTPATNHYYGLQLYSNDRNTGNGVDLFVGKNGDGMNWGLQAGVGTDAFSSVQAQLTQTVFLVVRCIFAGGTPDAFALYVNPTPGQPEPPTPDAVITNDIGTQNGIALNTGNGGAATFGTVRIGSTFASVTPTTSNLDVNLLAYEPFDYTMASEQITLLYGQGGGYGWDNVFWGQIVGGGSNYAITAGNLIDPSGLLSTTGNKATSTNSASSFAGRYNLFPGYGAAGSTAYWSILIRPETTPAITNYYGLQLFAGSGDPGLFVGKNGSGMNWGLEAGAGTDSYSSVACVLSQTVFLVVEGVFGTTNDTFFLYVNPTPGATQPATPSATLSAFIGTQNGIGINAGNGALASFDEIRIGTNYADVTPSVPVIVTNPFNIVSISISNAVPYPGIFLKWATTGGNTNVVQATSGSNGSYNTNGFANITAELPIPGSGVVTQTFLDGSAATNRPARYYRVLQVP